MHAYSATSAPYMLALFSGVMEGEGGPGLHCLHMHARIYMLWPEEGVFYGKHVQ